MAEPTISVSFAPDVVVQVTGDEAVLLKLTDEVVFSLNPTAARIAVLISEGVAVPTIIERLSAEYGAAPGAVSTDVHALIETLAAKLLVGIVIEDTCA